MVKVLQYGEGNFLRTFVDVYFDTLNKNDGGHVCGGYRKTHHVRHS